MNMQSVCRGNNWYDIVYGHLNWCPYMVPLSAAQIKYYVAMDTTGRSF